jgi:hypothetical protein
MRNRAFLARFLLYLNHDILAFRKQHSDNPGFEAIMKKNIVKNTGIRLLIDRYKKKFRISENLKYYSREDYQSAEKKFLKYALQKGKV